MADWGLLGGIGQGLQAGAQAYQQSKQQATENAMRKRQLQMQEMSGGFEETPEGGIQLSPQKQQERELAAGDTKTELALRTPDSLESQRRKETLRSALNLYKAGAGKIITDGMSGHEAQQVHDEAAKNLVGLQKAEISGQYGMLGRQITGERVKESNDIKREGLEERRNVNSAHAGQAFESDTTIKQTKQTLNSLARAESLLYGKEPITAKSFAILQQDFINSMAPGGAATEGKVNREMVNTAQESLNDLKLHFGNVRDLRTEQPQVVENLKNLIKQVKEDYHTAQGNQAKSIHDSFAQSTNPKVRETIKNKLKQYSPEHYSDIYGSGEPGGLMDTKKPGGIIAETNTQDVDAVQKYASDHGISFETANNIIEARKRAGAK